MRDAGLLLICVGVLFLPGAAVAAAAGLRVSLVLATAPLLGYGLATASGTVAGVVPVSWGPWLFAAEAGGLSVVLLLGRFLRRPVRGPGEAATARWRPPRPTPGDLWVAGGVVVGGLLSLGVLLAGMGGLDRPNQDWDYTFHANATRFIADTGDVAPSALRAVNDWESSSFFYPNAFHAVAAVLRDLTGAPVFPVLNVTTLLLGGIAGLGLAVLLRELGAPTAVTATTPVLLAGFSSFPYDVLWRGPLLPYAAGIALTPAFLLLVRVLLERRGPAELLLTALGGAALLGLHPSTALWAGLLTALMLVQRWLGRRRVPLRDVAVLALCGLFVALLAAPEVLGSIRTGAGGATMDWPAVDTPGQAAGRLLLLRFGTAAPQLVLSLLVLAGLVGLRRARYLWWCAGGAAVAGALFVLAASSDGMVAQVLTRPWWNDRWRLAALAVLGLAPLAASGTVQLSTAVAAGVSRLQQRRSPARMPLRTTTVLAALLAGVVVLSGGLYAPDNSRHVARSYQSTRYLNRAEITAMEWLGPRVAAGETVMNDPGDGSAYLSALEGVRPLFGHQVVRSTAGPTQLLLLDRFRCLDTDPRVRDAVARLKVAYVFLGTGFVRRSTQRISGLADLSGSPSLQLVYSHAGVRIYRVDLQPPAAVPAPGCAILADPTEPTDPANPGP